MATISQSLKLYDGMSPVLHNIVGAMNTMIGSMQRVQAASGNMMEVKSLNAAKEQLNNATREYDKMSQNIRGCTEQQEKYTSSVKNSTSAAGGLWSKVKGLAATYVSMQGLKSAVGISDKLAQTQGRLNLMVTDGGSVDALEQKIMASANRSRSAYMDTAQAISKMALNAGNAFNNNDEIIGFMEQVNKQFVIGGASAQEQACAMTQLTQAMAAGTLRGQDLHSVLEEAPEIARAIEKYMKIPEGSIRQYAEQGKITAEVVKNALLSSASETNAKFNSMPKTFGQIWIQFKNYALQSLEPVLQKMNQFANSPQFEEFMAHVAQFLPKIANMLLQVFQMIAQVGNFAARNWSILAPIILGVASALTIYRGTLAICNAYEKIHAALEQVFALREVAHATAIAAKTGATEIDVSETVKATAAQAGMNAQLLACPLTWIVIGIVAVVAAIYLVTAAINKAKGTSVSATGIIFGVFATAGAHIFNTFVVPLQNRFAMLGNFLMNVFKNPAAAVKVLFADLALTVLGYIRNIAQGFQDLLRHIPAFRNLDLTSGLNSAYNAVQGFKGQTEKESGYTEYFKKMDYMSYSGAAASGYKAGQGVDAKVSSLFGTQSQIDAIKNEMCGKSGPALTGISGDTKKISDAATKTKEDLKYLRDIAERDAINKLTTANIAINMGGVTNHNASDIDVDGAIDRMNKSLWNAAVSAAEGVHNA